MSFPTSSIFNITLKLFLENCNHIVPKRLHRFVSFLVCPHLGLSIKKHISIVTADYWHFTKRIVFVDTVYRAIGTRAHTTGNGCCRFALKQATMRACLLHFPQSTQPRTGLLPIQNHSVPIPFSFSEVSTRLRALYVSPFLCGLPFTKSTFISTGAFGLTFP